MARHYSSYTSSPPPPPPTLIRHHLLDLLQSPGMSASVGASLEDVVRGVAEGDVRVCASESALLEGICAWRRGLEPGLGQTIGCIYSSI
jgi:hypothetical protein